MLSVNIASKPSKGSVLNKANGVERDNATYECSSQHQLYGFVYLQTSLRDNTIHFLSKVTLCKDLAYYSISVSYSLSSLILQEWN